MNNYYETEPEPSCGIGNHATTGGWTGSGRNMNGSCIKCGHYVQQELDALIPEQQGKHRKGDDE